MLHKKHRRASDPVNAGSMADIAFLLLIFFLVTATIAEDQGIYVKLPVWEDDPPTGLISGRNVLSVYLNSANELLVEGEVTTIDQLRGITMDFIANPAKDPRKPTRPKNAIVSIFNDRGASYNTYLMVYNEIKAAYDELWEAAAQRNYGKSFDDLPLIHQRSIRNEIPLVVSEADLML